MSGRHTKEAAGMKSASNSARAALLAMALLAAVASLAPRTASAQSLVDGYWNLLGYEDRNEYGPGPEEGDYAGLPVTAAAIAVARSWTASQITLPEIVCRPFPSTYGPRAVTIMRVWEDRDAQTNEQTQIETWVAYAAQHRSIYMRPRPHPPLWAPKSWQGYSTGKWVGNVLQVHTDMLKSAFIARNGLPLDDMTTMDERFFRYGDVMIDVMMISDPQYLSRPVVMSKVYYRAPQGTMEPYPCEPDEEIPRPQGVVPMRFPGEEAMQQVAAVRTGIPLKAALGGAATMFPEYQDVIKAMAPNPPLADVEKAVQKLLDKQGAQSDH
jgi:hypothetical protein